MRGFHDLLRQKPSSLFILLGRSSISIASRLLSKNVKIRIYRTTLLPVVLYGCETRSLTLREEHGLRVLENIVPRRIFELKRG
jgi:hypothetical protein